MQYQKWNDSIPALKWGRENESNARSEYFSKVKHKHQNLEIAESGLVIDLAFPYLGASPDGIVCCGTGVIEIKCTYKYRHESPVSDNALADHQYFLKQNADDQIVLSHQHKYDQVQGQIAICNVSYCDFIVWCPNDIFIERIKKDDDYLPKHLPRLERFFCDCLLPELLTHKFIQNKEPVKKVRSVADTEAKFCLCGKGEFS